MRTIYSIYGIEVQDIYFKHPHGVTNDDDVTILWNFQLLTDKENNANRSDLAMNISPTEINYMIFPKDSNVCKIFYKKGNFKLQ